MKTQVVQDIKFGRAGNAVGHQVSGWSAPESGYTWTVGNRAEIRLAARFYTRYMLEFFAAPCINDEYPSQAMFVRANGTPIASVTMDCGEAFACFIGTEHIKDDGITITFEMPDAIRPCDLPGSTSSDDRMLGFRFSRLRLFSVGEMSLPPKIPAHDHTMLAFESLGENCDLGRYQRDIGLEPLGLLRFSGQPISRLIEAIDDRFIAFDNPDNILPDKDLVGNVYDVLVRPYDMFYHTFLNIESISEDRFKDQQFKYLNRLRRKFIEDTESGEKIFIYRRKKHIKPGEVLALYAAMNRIGRVNMLALGRADATHPGGSVQVIIPGLYYGYVSHFREEAMDPLPCPEQWGVVCQRVLDLAGE